MNRSRPGRADLAAVFLLAGLTLAVYAPVSGHDYVNYDDPGYVTANPLVLRGLADAAAVWTTPVEGNYHPLTMLSHQLDVSLFGVDRPGWHHLSSVALHLVNVLLLFVLARGLLGSVVAATLVAGLLAAHPLNVQSVAWIAERKNVLSTVLWLAGLLGWRRWLAGGGRRAYVAALTCCALGLLAKPMVVGFPATLLALTIGARRRWPTARELRALVPFAGLALAGGAVTLWAQHAVGAIQDTSAYPLLQRLGGAVVSYGWYLAKAVVPTGLAVFYPQPAGGFPASLVALSAVALVALAVAVWSVRKLTPWPLAGALWYVTTLAPVAGVIQVGAQAHADRYAYVPLIGVFLAAGAGVATIRRRSTGAVGVAVIGFVALTLAACGLAAGREVRHWENSLTLFSRAAEVTAPNAITLGNLGMAHVQQGDVAAAIPVFRRAVEAEPAVASSWSNLANALATTGDRQAAVRHYHEALRRSPGDPRLLVNLATTLEAAGRPGEAIVRYEAAAAATTDPAIRQRAQARIRAIRGRGSTPPSQEREKTAR